MSRRRPWMGRHEPRRDWQTDHAAVAAAATQSIRQHQAPYTGKHRGEEQA